MVFRRGDARGDDAAVVAVFGDTLIGLLVVVVAVLSDEEDEGEDVRLGR